MTQQLLKMLGTLLWILSATERYFKRNDCTNRSSTKLLFLYFEKIIEKKKQTNRAWENPALAKFQSKLVWLKNMENFLTVLVQTNYLKYP